MCSTGYTEINKSTRIDSILRLGKDLIEGYHSRHNSNLLLKQNKSSINNRSLNTSASFDNNVNKFNQRIIYSKNKSKSKILDGFADYDECDDDDDDDDKKSLTRIVRRIY